MLMAQKQSFRAVIFGVLGFIFVLGIGCERPPARSRKSLTTESFDENESADKATTTSKNTATNTKITSGSKITSTKTGSSSLITGNIQDKKSPIYKPDYDRMHPEIISKMKKDTGGHYDLHTVIPGKMEAGINGFAIITTKEKMAALDSFDKYVAHKEARGFKMHIITEDDFGGGIGVEAATNIRNWLNKNYKSKKLLYVLFLGNPHPREGDVPMRRVSADWRAKPGILKMGMAEYMKQNPKYDGYDGAFPTDYYYVDLESDWDLNKDGLLGDKGDYGEGGIDGQVDVYVGRIPYYGIDVPIGNAKEVNRILDRIISYETEEGDLSWRHDMFYNGGIFNRDKNYFDMVMKHNGAKLYRQAYNGSALWLEPEFDHEHINSDINAKRASGRYGFAYFQGHGFPTGGGGMSTNSAAKISDKYPKVYASGACLVGHPESPNNMMYALLRSSGIGAMGGTRSVTGCTGNRYVIHSYYPRLAFGNSLGEMLWHERAEQSKNNTIGMTNFLINLYGDPSVVPMPQVYGPSMSISPGWNARLSMIEGAILAASIPYEIRNNTLAEKTYKMEFHPSLTATDQTFTLAPGAYKKFDVRVKNSQDIKAGKYEYFVRASTDAEKKELGVILTVHPKSITSHTNFDLPLFASYTDRKTKKTTKVEPDDIMDKGILEKAVKIAKFPTTLGLGPIIDRNDFSMSFFANVKEAGRQIDLFSSRALSVTLTQGKVGVWYQTTGWSYGSVHSEHLISSLKLPTNKWTFINVRIDRANQKITLMVGDKTEELKVGVEAISRLAITELYVGRRDKIQANTEYMIDELTTHNYLISDTEIDALKNMAVAFTQYPQPSAAVNPKKIAFSWQGNKNIKKYKLYVADNPEFKNAKKIETSKLSYTASNLDDKKTYYWKVDSRLKGKWYKSELPMSFVTDASIKPIKIEIDTNFTLRYAAVVGVPGYAKKLSDYVKGVTEEQKKGLRYEKLSGPRWLEIYDDGLLFTNYGPSKEERGENKFKVRIKLPDGNTHDATFNVIVVGKRDGWTTKVNSSHSDNYKGDKALDGDMSTLWHTPWNAGKPRFPHSIEIDMKKMAILRGVNYMPRCWGEHANKSRAKGYAIYLSTDGKNWGSPVAKGTFDNKPTLKTIMLRSQKRARYLKFETLSNHTRDDMTVIPELDILTR